MRGADRLPLGDDRGAPEGVLELAHIARPSIADEGADGVVGERRVARGECRDECRDLGPSIAERREVDGEHLQPKAKVGPEAPGCDGRIERRVGGDDEPRRRAQFGHAADATKGAVLEHAEQPRLHVGGQLRDFVEKDGAVAGDLEQSAFRRSSVGEGAPLVPEQFALDERSRERGRVDGNERPASARGLVVNAPGRVPLAGARFAGEQHGHVVVARGEGEQALDAEHLVGGRDRGTTPRCAEQLKFPAHATRLGGAIDRGPEGQEVHRFLEQVDRALLHRAHRRGHIGVAGEHDDGDLGIIGAERLEEGESGGIGEAQVDDRDVARMCGGEPPTLAGR